MVTLTVCLICTIADSRRTKKQMRPVVVLLNWSVSLFPTGSFACVPTCTRFSRLSNAASRFLLPEVFPEHQIHLDCLLVLYKSKLDYKYGIHSCLNAMLFIDTVSFAFICLQKHSYIWFFYLYRFLHDIRPMEICTWAIKKHAFIVNVTEWEGTLESTEYLFQIFSIASLFMQFALQIVESTYRIWKLINFLPLRTVIMRYTYGN